MRKYPIVSFDPCGIAFHRTDGPLLWLVTFHDAVHSLYPDGSGYPIHECPIYGHQVRNESVQDAEEVFVDRNGRYFDIRYSVAPLSGGYQYGAVIEFRDVTEEKRRERQRLTAMMDNEHQAARVRHEELMRAQMSGFVDFVAHEVRNPLHGITANGCELPARDFEWKDPPANCTSQPSYLNLWSN